MVIFGVSKTDCLIDFSRVSANLLASSDFAVSIADLMSTANGQKRIGF